MNYRHHFHAGNFADVMKHALLVRLIAGLQKKEKGFLYLDTHAGRGSYDLTVAEHGDTLARQPEYPNGIGRLWTRADLPEPLAGFVALVKKFDAAERGGSGEARRGFTCWFTTGSCAGFLRAARRTGWPCVRSTRRNSSCWTSHSRGNPR